MTKTDIAEKTAQNETAEKTKTETQAKLFQLPQIAGGALAAVTSAAVGAQLGVAGTLIGAAVASVLAAVAGTLYTKGLERTRDGVKKIVLRDPAGDTEVLYIPDDGARESSAQTTAVPVHDTTSAQARSAGKRHSAATRPAKRSGWSSPWAVVGGMVATAAVTFVVAMGLITGWEFTSGQSLGGNDGTTIGQVSNSRSSATPTPSASATPSTPASPTPSTTTAAPTPTPTESVAPSATPTPSASEPMPTPSTATQTATGGE